MTRQVKLPQSSRFLLGMLRALRVLTDVSAFLALVMMALTVLIINHMIAIRLLGSSVVWHVELATYLTLCAIFLGSPYTARTKGHIAVELLERTVPRRFVVPVRIGINVVVVIVCAYLAYVGAEYAWDAFQTGVTSTSLWGPYLWPAYASMPIGLGLTALEYLAEMLDPTSSPRREHAQ